MQSQRALIREIQTDGGFQWNNCITPEEEHTETPSPARDTQDNGMPHRGTERNATPLSLVDYSQALENTRNNTEDVIDKQTVKSDDQDEMVEYIEDKRKRDQRFTKDACRLP